MNLALLNPFRQPDRIDPTLSLPRAVHPPRPREDPHVQHDPLPSALLASLGAHRDAWKGELRIPFGQDRIDQIHWPRGPKPSGTAPANDAPAGAIASPLPSLRTELIGRVAGVDNVATREVSAAMMRRVAKMAEFFSKLTGRAPATTVKNSAYAMEHFYVDASKAVEELGLPQTPIETALNDSIEWFRVNGYV